MLHGHTARIYTIAFDGACIASGGINASVCVWDVRSGTCIALLKTHTVLVCQIVMQAGLLVSGGFLGYSLGRGHFGLHQGAFAVFALLTGVAMAGASFYLQMSVVAVASLLGPPAMQSVMSGQAIVAIVISVVQLLGAMASVLASSDPILATVEQTESDAAAACSVCAKIPAKGKLKG